MSTTIYERLRVAITAAGLRLRDMSDADASNKPAPDKWSKKEILGHLIDSASNNHQRFVRAQLAGELRFPAYEQEGWARCQDYAHADWQGLINLWLAYNEHIAYIISRIPIEKMHSPCSIGNNDVVTLEFLIEDYLTHMNHHLRQLDRPIARC